MRHDFARVVKIRMTDEHVNLARWYEAVSNRESAKPNDRFIHRSPRTVGKRR